MLKDIFNVQYVWNTGNKKKRNTGNIWKYYEANKKSLRKLQKIRTTKWG